ncbi:cytochrome P450 [Mycobacterium cookii]|uniref:Putative cytochrome P450 143 n=1 Tax=Mycobacterium cookii TaxID=1775 RepID=A0A7I7L2X9_9MYCO|nr:cytochrome P450 [Mycobacterium cookii]MCV7329433.1 cytochrome P450 [Mycobacterium cookii]BBX48735.1 putative cytochrome P450 143 [Mycobacterium cookii]
MVDLLGDHYLTDHDDMLAALRDPTLVCPGADSDTYPWIPSTVPDPAEHARYRSILNPWFTPQALAPVIAAVQDHAVALVDAIADNGECDGIADIACPLASRTLLTVLGFPLTDLDAVIRLLDHYRAHRDDPKKGRQRVLDYVLRTIPQANPTGIVAALRDEFDHDELISFVMLLFTAAVDTGTVGVGFSLVELAGNPSLQAFLRSHPDQIGAFVSEALRLNPPITTCPRASLTEMTIGDVTLPAGARIVLPVQALNLDHGVEISIADNQIRSRPSYAFGGGTRRCLGVHLARAELTAVITEFLQRIPEFTTADGYSALAAEVDRYLTHLPLVW